METTQALVHSPAGVLAVLSGVCAFFFWAERKTGWRLFKYLVPLLWIYATPVVLRNTNVLPADSPVYSALRQIGLPMILVLLLLSVDVRAAFRVMGRGVIVMLLGTAGVVVGAPLGLLAVQHWLAPDAWKGFATLSGSWIGGTGNMAAVQYALDTSPEQFGLAVIADTVIYIIWLPILLASKGFADRFNRWARVDPKRLERMEEAALETHVEQRPAAFRDYLYLLFLGLAVTWIASATSVHLPEFGDPKVLTASTWSILIVTTLGIALSFTKAKQLPGSHELAMAFLYLFVARMGATASLEGLSQAPAFLVGALLWIFVHGLFCVAGAWLLRVDVHTVAIASAANIGAAASAPVVAAHHRESLVPVSVLMALIGYAIGNYVSILLIAPLCRWVAGG